MGEACPCSLGSLDGASGTTKIRPAAYQARSSFSQYLHAPGPVTTRLWTDEAGTERRFHQGGHPDAEPAPSGHCIVAKSPGRVPAPELTAKFSAPADND